MNQTMALIDAGIAQRTVGAKSSLRISLCGNPRGLPSGGESGRELKGKSKALAGIRQAFQEETHPGRTAGKEEACLNVRAGN